LPLETFVWQHLPAKGIPLVLILILVLSPIPILTSIATSVPVCTHPTPGYSIFQQRRICKL